MVVQPLYLEYLPDKYKEDSVNYKKSYSDYEIETRNIFFRAQTLFFTSIHNLKKGSVTLVRSNH